MTGFLGMRGTGDWPADHILENWRQTLLRLYPNGDAPLTAIMSMLTSEVSHSTTFTWSSKDIPSQEGPILGLYLDSIFSDAADGVMAARDVLYVNVSAATVSEFRVGHQAEVTVSTYLNSSVTGKVIGRYEAGTASYIVLRLKEAKDFGDATFPGEDYDTVTVIGSVNPEGATMPDGIAYDPTDYWNHTQIFRTPLSLTRTMQQTKVRYGESAYEEAKMECLELHAYELDKAFLSSERSNDTGANGKPERTTRGILKAIAAEQPDHFLDYRTDPAFTGMPWLEGGAKWLNRALERLSDYGDTEKMALYGGGASVGLQELVEAQTLQLSETKQVAYGLRVKEWITTHMAVYLKKAPMFSKRASYSNTMLIFEPKNLVFRYLQDTMFKNDPGDSTTHNHSLDGTEEEFLTEAGLEYHHLQTALVLQGVGLDNILT